MLSNIFLYDVISQAYFRSLSESIPVESPATARALSGAPDGSHVEYPGEVQVAPFLHCNVSDRRPRRLHTGHPREDIRHAGQIQVSRSYDVHQPFHNVINHVSKSETGL